jgi:hypothetical protein
MSVTKYTDEVALWHRMMILDEELMNRLRGNPCEQTLAKFCNQDLNGMLSHLSAIKQFMLVKKGVHPAGTDWYTEDAPMSDNWLALNDKAKRDYLDRDISIYMRR